MAQNKTKKNIKEIVLYIVFGVLTTVVNFVVFKLFNMLLGEKLYLLNNTVAFIVSVLFAYVTNKIWVFESKKRDAKTIVRELSEFFGARIFTFLIEEGGLWLFIGAFGFDKYSINVFGLFSVGGKMIAKIILAVIVVILNYIFSKFWIFKKKEEKKDELF